MSETEKLNWKNKVMIDENVILEKLKEEGFGSGISGVRVTDGRVTFVMELDAAQGGEMETLRQKAEKAVTALDGVTQVTVIMTAKREGGQKSSPLGLKT